MNLQVIAIIFLLVGLLSCAERPKTVIVQEVKGQPIKLRQTDTTLLGWEISYLTNPDSSLLYIKWSKDSFNNQYIDSNAATVFESDYRPVYSGESATNLYMPYRCASDCEGLMVLSKEGNEVRTFLQVLKFDAASDKVVMLEVENCETGELKVRIANLRSEKDTTIRFENQNIDYYDLHKERYIDSIRFENNKVFIRASFHVNKDTQTKEVKSVEL